MAFKMFDASPFKLGGFAAADPIGVYSTLFMSYPQNEGFPVANISPTNDGYPWNAYVPVRHVVGPASPRRGWPSSDPVVHRQKRY
jgi:hypothetical protein